MKNKDLRNFKFLLLWTLLADLKQLKTSFFFYLKLNSDKYAPQAVCTFCPERSVAVQRPSAFRPASAAHSQRLSSRACRWRGENSKQFQTSISLYVFSTRSQCPSQPTVLPSVSATTFKCSCPLPNWLDSPILSNRLVSFQYTYLKVYTMMCSLLRNHNHLPLPLPIPLSLIIQVFTCQDYLLQAFVFESNLRSL